MSLEGGDEAHDKNGMPLDFGAGGPCLPSVPSPQHVPHCAVRAKERYGIDLTWDDVSRINDRCASGEGRMGGKPDGTQFHLITFGRQVLWVVYKPHGIARREQGMVVTIMPPTIAMVAARSDSEHKARRLGNYAPRKRRWQ